MKKLIIITGMNGTGKSSLAKELNKRIEDSTFISFDILLENINDIVGFSNKEEKKSLRTIIKRTYKQLIKEALRRSDSIVILEYPFRKSWSSFFEKIIKEYGYEVYTINLFARDFDTIWKRLIERESSKERHPSHYLESYRLEKKEEYVPYFEYQYDKHKKEYEQGTFNHINLGTIINIEDIEKMNIEDIEKMNIDELIQKIVGVK